MTTLFSRRLVLPLLAAAPWLFSACASTAGPPAGFQSNASFTLMLYG